MPAKMQHRLSRHGWKLPSRSEYAMYKRWHTPSEPSWTENLSDADVEHMQNGVGIILGYLNSCNTWQDVSDVESSARQWCRVYYSTLESTRYVPETVMAHHPHLFNLDIASWLRLDNFKNPYNPSSSSSHDENKKHELFRAKSHLVCDESDNNLTSLSSEESGRDHTKATCNEKAESSTPVSGPSETFPRYSEPIILCDQDLVNILASYDLAKALEEDLTTDEYREHRVPFTAADLFGSPIKRHIPEVIRNLAGLDMNLAIEKQVGFEEEVDLDAGLFLQGLVWAKIASDDDLYHDAPEMGEKMADAAC